MAAIRTFFKRTVGQHSSDNNNRNPGGTATDSSSDTSSSTTSERLNNRINDGYSSTSALGVLVNNDDSLRRPLLNIPSTNRRRRFLLRLINNSSTMNTQNEQIIDENTCLLDKKLPKELLLRIFSFLDYQSLCRCAQVSKVKNSKIQFLKKKKILISAILVLEYTCIRWIKLAND
jgi:hypothetical protein